MGKGACTLGKNSGKDEDEAKNCKAKEKTMKGQDGS